MDPSKIRSITNNYSDVRLISLREWRSASQIEPRDTGGPYMVYQDGYDPADPTSSYDEFLLGKSGEWITVGVFHQLPHDIRRDEFVYGTAAQVIGLLENLSGNLTVIRTAQEAAQLHGQTEAVQPDDLTSAFVAAKESGKITGPASPAGPK